MAKSKVCDVCGSMCSQKDGFWVCPACGAKFPCEDDEIVVAPKEEVKAEVKEEVHDVKEPQKGFDANNQVAIEERIISTLKKDEEDKKRAAKKKKLVSTIAFAIAAVILIIVGLILVL